MTGDAEPRRHPEATEAHLGVQPGQRALLATGAGRSGQTDLSDRIDAILAAELGQPR
jgi:hypothetical protein